MSIDCTLPRTRTIKIRTRYESELKSIYGRCFIVNCLQIIYRITVMFWFYTQKQLLNESLWIFHFINILTFWYDHSLCNMILLGFQNNYTEVLNVANNAYDQYMISCFWHIRAFFYNLELAIHVQSYYMFLFTEGFSLPIPNKSIMKIKGNIT